MKHLSDFLPLDICIASGHCNGVRNETLNAGLQSIGQTVNTLHASIHSMYAEPTHGVDESDIELQFESGDTLRTSVAHGGEALLLSTPIGPSYVCEDGFGVERRDISADQPWGTLVGLKIEKIDALLMPRRKSHVISGFLLHFSPNIRVGFRNLTIFDEGTLLSFDPVLDDSDRVLVNWL